MAYLFTFGFFAVPFLVSLALLVLAIHLNKKSGYESAFEEVMTSVTGFFGVILILVFIALILNALGFNPSCDYSCENRSYRG